MIAEATEKHSGEGKPLDVQMQMPAECSATLRVCKGRLDAVKNYPRLNDLSNEATKTPYEHDRHCLNAMLGYGAL